MGKIHCYKRGLTAGFKFEYNGIRRTLRSIWLAVTSTRTGCVINYITYLVLRVHSTAVLVVPRHERVTEIVQYSKYLVLILLEVTTSY